MHTHTQLLGVHVYRASNIVSSHGWLMNAYGFFYRVSDLRVVELLDGLCEKMQEYTLEKVAYLFPLL